MIIPPNSFWKNWAQKPAQPIAGNLPTSYFDPGTSLKYDTTYKWQIAAKNVMGTSPSPEWDFTTGQYPYYLMNALLILQTMVGIDVGDLSFIEDINKDGQKGLPEVIYSIQKAAAIR